MAKEYNLRLIGFVGGWDFNSRDVDDACKKHKDHLDILVDSTGGSVATALSICEAFKAHNSVHVHLRGINASAATLVAMGAHHVTMARTGMFMIHNSRMEVFQWDVMTEKDIRQKIEELDEKASMLAKTDLTIATLYADKTGMSIAQALELMSKETWLTAKEAKDLGFVDEITDYDDERKKPHISACMSDVMASAGIPVPDLKDDDRSYIKKLLQSIIPKSKPDMKQYTLPAAFVTACGCDKSMNQSEDGTVAVAVDHIETVAGALDSAEKARKEAEDKLADSDKKVKDLEDEIAKLKAQTPADGNQKKVIEDQKKGTTENSLADAVKIYNSLR